MEQIITILNNEIKKLQDENFIKTELVKDYTLKVKTFKKIIKLSKEVKTDISIFEQEIESLEKSIDECKIKILDNNVKIVKYEKVKSLLNLE